MKFRKTVEADISSIMTIIRQAQDYFKDKGIDQWQNGYPNPEVIRKDIANGHSYVLLKEDNIVGTAAISFDGENTYDDIYEGQWLSNDTFAVIHRIAVDNDYKGLGLSSIIIENVEELCKSKGVSSIKVDTHEDNLSMQRLLKKNGFQFCGIIYLEDKSKRVAFEKLI
ncbi:GNAT family N-acetyltransferase [Clostridium manihotivorum]|uniref:GNAT family N-acetyltransferase n=1 Tax=Clostridium manihotivorum TaxID=2320868 RepID=A0A3R5TI15_9CLOT|nr:GNAT family N-acetyltransferase [Clostridium manihotivorum]QAA33914.1 GNAT family N-acetyltransferase [Clostridium manihotivorum]